MSPRLTVYWAHGCHLCEPAKVAVRAVATRLGVPVDEVDITGSDELEARYRESIPVVELDGRRLAKYVVDADDLAARVSARLAAAG
jgi:glutaredoxin